MHSKISKSTQIIYTICIQRIQTQTDYAILSINDDKLTKYY